MIAPPHWYSSRMRAVEVEIAASAEQCYRLLCDVQRVPEWVPGVADVRIVERDERGRPSLVRFTSMPGRGSLEYLVRYSYDDEAHCVRWTTEDGGERELSGEAAIVDHGRGWTRLRYALMGRAASSLPFWARDSLSEDRPQPVADAFKRWVERQRTSPA
jgi:ribosome-associated toxin RatA of RatAB toxin-antitoxin module